jgi:hypothetical protein
VNTFVSQGSAFNASISGDLMFLCEADDGVTILSISDPANPAQQSTVDTPVYANDAFCVDTILYVADDSAGVLAYSVSDPLNPYVLTGYNSPGAAKGVAASDTTIFIGDNESFIILVHTDTPTGIEDTQVTSPMDYSIQSVYPNPFNPEATVRFGLEKSTEISLTVYDIEGQVVDYLLKQSMNAGTFEITWNGDNYPSGIYLFRLAGDGFGVVKKATLLK